MIDTDKYEGHSPQHEWMLRGSGEPELCRFADGDVMLSSYWLSCPATKANQKLIADAPKLLAEVKQLRRVIHGVVVDLTVTNIGGPDSQGAAVKAALNTLSEVMYVD